MAALIVVFFFNFITNTPKIEFKYRNLILIVVLPHQIKSWYRDDMVLLKLDTFSLHQIHRLYRRNSVIVVSFVIIECTMKWWCWVYRRRGFKMHIFPLTFQLIKSQANHCYASHFCPYSQTFCIYCFCTLCRQAEPNYIFTFLADTFMWLPFVFHIIHCTWTAVIKNKGKLEGRQHLWKTCIFRIIEISGHVPVYLDMAVI